MKQGIITLLPKPGKDKRYIDNLRPITLLNVDYKLFTQIFANRLKEGMGQIISETQSGFLKDRSIHNNIRLVLDLLDYKDFIEDTGFILFLDFYKAFDSVEHPFIIKTLEHFGFGSEFIKVVNMIKILIVKFLFQMEHQEDLRLNEGFGRAVRSPFYYLF